MQPTRAFSGAAARAGLVVLALRHVPLAQRADGAGDHLDPAWRHEHRPHARIVRRHQLTLNPGAARIGDCETKVDAVEDGGIIVGANVAAWSGVCATISADKAAYQACMDGKKEEWRASGMLTGKQAAA